MGNGLDKRWSSYAIEYYSVNREKEIDLYVLL